MNDENIIKLKKELKQILAKYRLLAKYYMKKYQFHKERINEKHSVWLDGEIVFSSKSPQGGRPSAEFAVSNIRTKYQQTKTIRESFSPKQLTFAAESSHKQSGSRDLGKLIQQATISPTRPKKILDAFATKQIHYNLSDDEALSLFVEARKTKRTYQLERNIAKSKGVIYIHLTKTL